MSFIDILINDNGLQLVSSVSKDVDSRETLSILSLNKNMVIIVEEIVVNCL